MRVCRGNIKLRQRQKYMPEDISWGPVIGQNTVTGHGVLPLTPLKYFIGHIFMKYVLFLLYLRKMFIKIFLPVFIVHIFFIYFLLLLIINSRCFIYA